MIYTDGNEKGVNYFMTISLSPKQFEAVSMAVKFEEYRLGVLEDRNEMTSRERESLKSLRQAIRRAGFLT